jgi:hypothetical protein
MIIMNDTSGLYLKVPSDFNFIKVVQWLICAINDLCNDWFVQ